jgi:four helix bundle protein
VQDFKKLDVWQRAHALSLAVHRATAGMRNAELSSLRSQTFRAAMSIPANIAEGRRQSSDRQFSRYLGYALNSSSELEHHLIVARDLNAIGENQFDSLVSQTITVRKMLFGLLKRLREPVPVAKARSQPPLRPKPPAGSPEL